MSPSRPVRYRPTPEPPSGRRPAPRLEPRPEPPGKPPRRWPIWAAGLLGILLLAAMAYLVGMQRRPGPAPAPAPAGPAAKPTAALPSTWNQDYDSSFRYTPNTVTVDYVSVKGLDRPGEKEVLYRLVIRNDRSRFEWIEQRDRWIMRNPKLRRAPYEIKKRNFGRQRYLFLRYRWPRWMLYKGSSLQMIIPSEGGPQTVLLGLEVPENHQGVAQNRSVAGLTR